MGAIRHGCSNRLFEWATTAMMLGIAVTLLLSPRSIEASSFHLMLQAGVPQQLFALFFVSVGLLRVAALIANGRWPIYGPLARALGAIAGAVIWGQLCLALIGMSPITGTVSLGVPVYIVLVGGELFSCFRAVSDGRRYPDR